jgi:hypothetical protein
LEIIELFRYPCIRALAEHLSGATTARTAPPDGQHRTMRHRNTMSAMRKSVSFRQTAIEPGSS